MVKQGGLEEMIKETTAPKILSLDIETSPIIAYTWGPKYETNLIELLQQSNIICYSAKWLDGKQQTRGLIDYKGYKKGDVDDTALVKDVHAILDTADIVITQNGVDFDIKTLNARFLKHGLAPPSPFKVIDTKREAKKYLRLPSYSLDEMGAYFNLGSKMKHEGFDLWKKCMAGDKNAWNKMKKYNAQDVRLMEKLYDILKPYMKTHPNVLTYSSRTRTTPLIDTGACPKCASTDTHARGYIVNSVSKYARAQCQGCGNWYRYGKNVRAGDRPGVNI